MSEALTREEYNKELLVIGQPETDTDHYIEALTNLQRHDAAQRATIQQLQGRLRETAQLLIAEIGAAGPENAESVAGRAVAKIQQQEETIAAHDAIKTKLEIKIQELMAKQIDQAERIKELEAFKGTVMARLYNAGHAQVPSDGDKDLVSDLLYMLLQRREEKIQELTSQIESLESTNRIAALALAEKEAEIARLKDIVRREAWLEQAVDKDVPGPYVPWEDHRRELATLEAEIERMKQDVNDLNQVLRNHGLAQGEIDAEASIDWRAEAKWAAEELKALLEGLYPEGAFVSQLDNYKQAQRILEEA